MSRALGFAIKAALFSLAMGACASSELNTGATNDPSIGADASPPDAGRSPGPPGSPTAEAPTGSCDPAFCPSNGFGEACCVGPNGPCGFDMGMGCVSPVSTQADGG